MKKLTSVVLMLLLLCGCGRHAVDVTKEMREADGFSAHAIVQYFDKQYAFTVERDAESIRVVMETPQALNGFSVILTQDSYTIGYHDVSFHTDTLPENMEKIVGPVFALCDAIAKQEGEHLPDGIFIYQSGDMTATCHFDMDAGVPISLHIGNDFSLEFTDFTYT